MRYCLQPLPFSHCHPQLLTIKLLCSTVLYLTLSTLPALRNQPATDNPAGVSIHTRYLPPVPPKVRERIIKGEYIDFATLLPKAMFSSSMKPESSTSFTFQLPSNSEDISVCPATKPKSIMSFSNWMEAWNIYLAVCIDHMPFRAPSLIAYQRIITSASIQYPP